jgi:hypothetical protein
MKMTIISIDDALIIGCVVNERKLVDAGIVIFTRYEKLRQLSRRKRRFGLRNARTIAEARGWRVIEGGAGDGKRVRIH